MFESIFKRVEEKYLLTEEEKNNLFKRINKYITHDCYYKSTICNIYFDNKNKDLIVNSLEKPEFKEKIRIRSYDIPKIDDYVFLEIKEKYKGVVGKRRIKIKLRDFYNYLKTHKYDKHDQIMNEINYYFEYYNLEPSVFIGYDRLSYRGIDNKELRITIDTNLRSRFDNLKLELGDAGKKLFHDKYYIMEIKTLGSMPLWLVRSLSELKIYPVSFSKYGKIYEEDFKINSKLKEVKEMYNYA